ncbi:siderophore-interacting protein [uncultured Amnibacterium sp.]|uniref:siderophore-interacting protein n=1 Tax=uncultured Amnibacterium sp. TaxID=1631851 RepID=UPI0035C9EBC6
MSTFPLAAGRDREAVRHELVRRTVRVLGRTDLPGHLVRVTVGGDELAGFASVGPADHVKVFLPTSGGVVARDYTPSEYRPVGASSGPELDLDFVVHGEEGPASAWALTAAPGDEVSFGGPRGSRLAPSGYRNALVIADPSGLPALRRWVRAFAGVVPVHALLFGGAEAVGYLDDAELAAATPQVLAAEHDLVEVVASQDLDDDSFVFAAGEATALVPVRRHLRERLPKEHLSLHGYWRRGDATFDHHSPLDPSDPD